MTPTQYTTLKAAILADPAINTQPMGGDGDFFIATYLNQLAAPTFTVWKTLVPIGVVGDNLVATELAGLTTANNGRLQTIALFSPIGINPSLTDRRAFFDDVFSGAGGALTRAKLLSLWKRAATRFEKLYATGTGSDASPATVVLEGAVSPTDVGIARES